jgi:hypothetical protein
MNPRPQRYSKEVNAKVAELLWPKVLTWLEGEDADIQDLVDAVNFNCDGYAIARELDHDGWDPDSDLVEILDQAEHFRYGVLKDLSILWVKENNLQGPDIGSRVNWAKGPKGATEGGEVVENHEDGKSSVKFCQARTYYVPWEDLTVVITP